MESVVEHPVKSMEQPRTAAGLRQEFERWIAQSHRQPKYSSEAYGVRAPKCGQRHIFKVFLKVADACDHCGELLRHHRADDMPAYVVMSIVGHIVVALVLWTEVCFAPPLWVHAALWLPLTMGHLPQTTGAIVGLQWLLRMHGFGSRPTASTLMSVPSCGP